MSNDGLDDYSLNASLHTVQIKTPATVENVDKKIYNCVRISNRNKNGTAASVIKINANELQGDLFSFDEFRNVFTLIVNGMSIDSFNVIRADMRLDNYDSQHYERYSKLNKYLIAAIAVTYKAKNCYITRNLFTEKQLSVAVKTDYIQIENYNRSAKSEIEGNCKEPAKARLELRTMPRQWRTIRIKNEKQLLLMTESEASNWNVDYLKNEFMGSWFVRLDKSIRNLDKVEERYNSELKKMYDEGKNSYPKKFRSVTDFIMQYQDCIFTRQQLINLIDSLGIENAEQKAKDYRKRYGIQLFNSADVERAVAEIKRAIIQYFAECEGR